MSHSKNVHKFTDKSVLDTQTTDENAEKGAISCDGDECCTYADQLCQLTHIENATDVNECNVEVLSLNEVFPTTSEESLSNEDEPTVRKRRHGKKGPKLQQEMAKSTYVPTNSKSSTTPGREKDILDAQAPVHSDFDIPKNTMYVIGSNPGEPKMSYQDPPKKMTKTMKKFLRNIDKHKNYQNKNSEKAISKLTTMRGILKDGRCGPECTGDSSVHDTEDFNAAEELTSLPHYAMEFGAHVNYAKQSPDKNVSFNTQVLIIHFTGDLCVGQSIETLSKEKDQQARNSELRKTFLTKYNELWPTEK
ncbi:uncharacterized protein LOC120630740 isoform X2 [Pararge aegeria]|uniref:uncharacterized protein LOC120630740 isoform X2 n=1 Tax=Pararge aegeria TaxID=116150 RepID=UPI0019D21C85|nr:uncharacterized protein LOC120630740 isoform X2 [Pararge aegeria]